MLDFRSFPQWPDIQRRFQAWWAGDCIGRPMMRVVARLDEPTEPLEQVTPARTPEEHHLDVRRHAASMRNHLRSARYYAEAYPNLDVNIGPGSMALYLGGEPGFAWDTVWFRERPGEWDDYGPLAFDPENAWWKRHYAMVREAVELAEGRYLVNIPDIIENADILAALRGPQRFCYDLVDEPERMEQLFHQVDALYFLYYDAMRELTRQPDGGSQFTAFQVQGPGRTAKVQCDFCALMSPAQFRRFIQPSLKQQCDKLDQSVYHLDGKDCIKHLPALMEISSLNALQWTCGAGQPDGGSEKWYPIYDQVRAAKKALHISIYDGDFEDWVRSGDRLVARYGPRGMYFLFPMMSVAQAERLLAHAENEWRP